MKASRSSKKTSGFTLVELIVVLVILATLAALLVPSLTGYIDKARQNAVIAKARAVLVASQAVVTEAYADGKLVLDEYGELYTPPDPESAIAHAMAKEIMALAEIVNVFPVYCRRLGITKGTSWIVIFLAIGKTLGSLFHFYMRWGKG